MKEQNLELVKKGYAAFAAADFDTIKELMTPDGLWHSPGEPFLPEYKGFEAIVSYFTALFDKSGGTIKVTPTYLYPDDERVVAIQHIYGEREGKTLDTDVVMVFEIAGGKIYKATEYIAEPTVYTAFWN